MKKPKRPTRRAVWVSRVNLANFSDKDWVKRGGWPQEYVYRTIDECRETLRIEALYTGETK